MMASGDVAVDQLLECTICLCHFSDPRTLPCLHTFCLSCLKQYAASAKAKSKVQCPSCRKECALPHGGIQALPKNFVMNTLSAMVAKSSLAFSGPPLQAEESAAGAVISGQCGNWEADNPHPEATVFCKECGQNFCDECRDAHKMFPATRKHTLTPISPAEATKEASPSSPTRTSLSSPFVTTPCQLHPDIALSLYCQACSQPLCKSCAANGHKKHKLERLDTAVASCKAELEAMDEAVAEILAHFRDGLKILESADDHVKELVEKAHAEVDVIAEKQADQLRKQQERLKKRVTDLARDVFFKAATSKADLEAEIGHLESIYSYRSNLEEHGREVDLIRHTPALREQLARIRRTQIQSIHMELDIDRAGDAALHVGSAKLAVSQKQTVAESKVAAQQLKKPRLLYGIKLNTRVSVTGLALIGRYLCVTTSDVPNIWVYASEGRLVKGITVPDLDRATAMVKMSDVKRRLVIVENSMLPEKKQLHSLVLTNEMNIKKHVPQKLTYTPEGVSVDSSGNVIVTSSIPKQLVIYDAKLVQRSVIQLQDASICQPVAAVKTDHGYSIVDHSNSLVTLLDEQGHVMHKYGVEKKLGHPLHAVTHPLGLLVADRDMNRVLLHSQERPYQQQLIQIVNSPTCLFWESNTERLYVGQEGNISQSVVKVYTWQAIQSLAPSLQSPTQTLPATLTHHYTLTLDVPKM